MPDTVMQSEAQMVFRNRSTETAKLAAALAAAQKNFASIPKDREVTVQTQTGGSYKFKYATLDAICAATFPALAEQGLAISQALTSWGDNYALETTLFHSSGEWLSNVTPMFLSGRRTREDKELSPGNQELGSAQTYARRYGISALLCITADEDDDANHADGNHSERTPFRPGPAGSAGGGTQFRPERRGGVMAAATNSIKDARADIERDGPGPATVKSAAKSIATQPTAAEKRAAKLKETTDKRIDLLKNTSGWTRPTLDQFWADNKTWIDWMADPVNGALAEYERFTAAFSDAEVNMKEIA